MPYSVLLCIAHQFIVPIHVYNILRDYNLVKRTKEHGRDDKETGSLMSLCSYANSIKYVSKAIYIATVSRTYKIYGRTWARDVHLN
jgi:hypothetical protein